MKPWVKLRPVRLGNTGILRVILPVGGTLSLLFIKTRKAGLEKGYYGPDISNDVFSGKQFLSFLPLTGRSKATDDK